MNIYGWLRGFTGSVFMGSLVIGLMIEIVERIYYKAGK